MEIRPSQLPVFILAGGLGTRISEESALKPKPMIEVGDLPVLLHVMRSYYAAGFNDFVICAGYKAWEIKKYFLTYEFRSNHLDIDHREDLHERPKTLGRSLTQEKWRVRVIDTGQNSMTGARVARAFDSIAASQSFEHFALTYGDGLCDVDLKAELDFHLSHKKVGTVMGVKPVARFGELDVGPNKSVEGFLEKPESRQGLINGGFFLFKKSFREYLDPNEECILERAPLEKLTEDRGLMMFEHQGFWHPMDTLRDKIYLQSLWDKGEAPWAK